MTTKNKFYHLCISLIFVVTCSNSFAKEVTPSNPIITMKKSSNSKGIGDRLEALVKNFTTYAEKEIKEKNGVDVIFDVNFSSFKTVFASTEIIKLRRPDSKYVIPLNLNPLDFNNVDFSEDSLALALCHELGHHRKNIELVRQYNFYSPYALNEFWADWFSVDNCMNHFRNAKGLKYIKETKIPEEVSLYCKKQNLASEDYNLCARASLAALNLVRAIQEKRFQVTKASFQKVSLLKSVSLADMDTLYPEDQCRLDIHKTQISCHLKNEGTCEKPACWTEGNDY